MMRHRPAVVRLLLPLGMFLAGGCSKNSQETGIIVEVRSDLSVPRDLNQLAIVATNSGGAEVYRHTFDLGTGQGRVPLPVQAGLFPLDDGTAPVHITATGTLGGTARVSRSATLSFVKGRKVLLVLDLLAVCENVPCSQANWTCVSSGQCEPDSVDGTKLPNFIDGNRGAKGSGGADGGPGGAHGLDGGPVNTGGVDGGPSSADAINAASESAGGIDSGPSSTGGIGGGPSSTGGIGGGPSGTGGIGPSNTGGIDGGPGDGPTLDAAFADVSAPQLDLTSDMPGAAADESQALGVDAADDGPGVFDLGAADSQSGGGGADLLPGCDSACRTFYYDGDGDGFGVALLSRCLCAPSAPYTASVAGDCDDGDAVVTTCAASVTETISLAGAIDFSKLATKYGPVSSSSTHARWKVTAQGPQIPSTLTFYASLTSGSNLLSVLTTGPTKDALRGFIPDAWVNETTTGADWSRVYTPAETLLRMTLVKVVAALVADGLVGASAAPHGSFVYSAAAVPSVIVAEAYMTANPWNFGASSFHHWPFGDATASCGYDPQNYSCSTASGTGEKLYTLTLANPKTAFLLTHSGCDNGEESRVEVDGSVWAHQINSGGSDLGSGFEAGFPTTVHLWSQRTWSEGDAGFWYAAVADDLSIVTTNEPPDLQTRIDLGTVFNQPRLALRSSGVSASNSAPKVGDVITLGATITNPGDLDAPDTSVYFYLDGPPVASRFAGKTVVSIPAGGTATAAITWTAIGGVHNLGVIDGYNSGDSNRFLGGVTVPLNIP
jgi:hypothetical protein